MSVIVLSVICGILAVSTGCFSYLYFTLLRRSKENPNFETQLIISDMLRGNALVRIERISPEDIYLRRQ